MSKYFVVKASGANISIPVLDEAPAKPYIPIKGKGYIPLTTETNTTGIKVKGNNGKRYKAKVVTTTQVSGTYLGDYTTTYKYTDAVSESVSNGYVTTSHWGTTTKTIPVGSYTLTASTSTTSKDTLSAYPRIADPIIQLTNTQSVRVYQTFTTTRPGGATQTVKSYVCNRTFQYTNTQSCTVYIGLPYHITTSTSNTVYESTEYTAASSSGLYSLTISSATSYQFDSLTQNGEYNFEKAIISSSWNGDSQSVATKALTSARYFTFNSYSGSYESSVVTDQVTVSTAYNSQTQSKAISYTFKFLCSTSKTTKSGGIQTFTVGNAGNSSVIECTNTITSTTGIGNSYTQSTLQTAATKFPFDIYQFNFYGNNVPDCHFRKRTSSRSIIISTSIVPDYECTSYWTETTII